MILLNSQYNNYSGLFWDVLVDVLFHGINPNFPQLSLRFSTLETHWQPSSRRDRALFMFSCRNTVLRTPHVLCVHCMHTAHKFWIFRFLTWKKTSNANCDKHTYCISHAMFPRHIDELQQHQHVGASKLIRCFTKLKGWVMLPVLDPKDHINSEDCLKSLSTRWIHLCQYHVPAKQWAHGGELISSEENICPQHAIYNSSTHAILIFTQVVLRFQLHPAAVLSLWRNRIQESHLPCPSISQRKLSPMYRHTRKTPQERISSEMYINVSSSIHWPHAKGFFSAPVPQVALPEHVPATHHKPST